MNTVKYSSSPPIMPKSVASTAQKAGTPYLSCVRERFFTSGKPGRSVDIMMASRREVTRAQYDIYIKKWSIFCTKAKCDLVNPPISVAIDFLASLFDAGFSYASINTPRCALSLILLIEDSKIPFSQLQRVKRFMKGIFELK